MKADEELSSVAGLPLYAAGSGENAQLLGTRSLFTYAQPCRQGPRVRSYTVEWQRKMYYEYIYQTRSSKVCATHSLTPFAVRHAEE